MLFVGHASVPAQAQEPLTDNDFTIDLASTPVLGASRIVGMGGAYTALAAGMDGVAWNPAAHAARTHYELDDWEWELTGSVLFPGSFAEQDFFLNDRGNGFGTDQFVFLDLGFRLQWKNVGGGVSLQSQIYTYGEQESITFTTWRVGGGYGLFDGQLVLGAAARIPRMTMVSEEEELVRFEGVGAEVGALYGPEGLPFRVGASFRTPVSSVIVQDPEAMEPMPERVAGFLLPRSLELPWEVQIGGAVQFGPRPLNRRFVPQKPVEDAALEQLRWRWCQRERAQVLRELRTNGEPAPPLRCPRLARRARDRAWVLAERERQRAEREALDDVIDRGEDAIEARWEDAYDRMPRQYVLVSADLVLMGPVDDGVGVDAFLNQERLPRGEQWSVGFRLGVEGEPWPNRLKLRAGMYVEPARYSIARRRTHGTAGLDLRLFELWGWDLRTTLTVDGARDYISWGVGVGLWH